MPIVSRALKIFRVEGLKPEEWRIFGREKPEEPEGGSEAGSVPYFLGLFTGDQYCALIGCFWPKFHYCRLPTLTSEDFATKILPRVNFIQGDE